MYVCSHIFPHCYSFLVKVALFVPVMISLVTASLWWEYWVNLLCGCISLTVSGSASIYLNPEVSALQDVGD